MIRRALTRVGCQVFGHEDAGGPRCVSCGDPSPFWKPFFPTAEFLASVSQFARAFESALGSVAQISGIAAQLFEDLGLELEEDGE